MLDELSRKIGGEFFNHIAPMIEDILIRVVALEKLERRVNKTETELQVIKSLLKDQGVEYDSPWGRL
jgi:hypothetical protein